MKSALPLILLAVLLLAMVLFTRRNRERAMAQQTKMRERIGFGTEVMTTSGLYGTVTGVNTDDSVQLSIAPGVEVKWAIAALRDVQSLPNQYRQGVESDEPLPTTAMIHPATVRRAEAIRPTWKVLINMSVILCRIRAVYQRE